ncbi:MAG: right-handed parallel beta-helix repeat-containing protein [Lentimonas sp.]
MKLPTQLMILAVVVTMVPSLLSATQVTVSVGGEIASLKSARDAVRELRANGEQGDINVVIQEGVYTLNETLIFDLIDSAPAGAVTRYKGAAGARPIISGGRVIDGWKQSELAGGKIWVADVPWATGDAYFHALFDVSELLPRAKSAAIQISTPKGKKNIYASVPEQRVEFTFEKGALKQWDNLQDIEFFGSPSKNWMVNYLPIESLDLKALKGHLAIPATYRMAGEFVIENSIEYLDTPGEWVLNSQQGKLYYWPKLGQPSAQIIAPVLNELVRIEGVTDASLAGAKDQPVEGIVFEGLQFSHADRQKWLADDKGIQHDWNMWDKANGLIRFRGARNCVVTDCVFIDSGSDGVRMDLFSQGITVENSHFSNLGGTGVLLSGYGPGLKDVNKGNIVRSNEITKVGTLFLHSPGIFIWQSGHNEVSHNHVYDLAYTGILVTGVRRRFFEPVFEEMGQKDPFPQWVFHRDTREHSSTIRWDEIKLDGDITDWATYEPYMHARHNVLEFNEVHDCLKVLHDGNCIYLSGNGDGNIVRHNVTYNHAKYGMIRTDDDSHNALVQGNLLFGTISDLGIKIKGLNTATGNVFINCLLTTGGAGNTIDPDSELSRNVFYHTTTNPRSGFHYRLPKVKGGLDYNLYYHEKLGKAEALFAAQKKSNKTKLIDRNSVVADPMFIDHLHGDFGFKAGSPAFDLGIEPLALEVVSQMGTFQDPFIKRFAAGMPIQSK